MAAAIMVAAGLVLFSNFNLRAQEEPVPIGADTVMVTPQVVAPVPIPAVAMADTAQPPEEVKKDFNFWMGIAAGIFLMIWPILRLFITDAATRTALDAWAAIIQQLRIAKDPKTINDLLKELKKIEPQIPKAALKQWKQATAKAKKRGGRPTGAPERSGGGARD